MTTYTYLQTRREGPVLIATMVNPPKNFLNAPMVEELLALAGALADDKETRVLVLTGGADGIFITHYDVGELTLLSDAVRSRAGDMPPRADAPADRPRRELHALNRLSLKLAALPQPVIAAINGTAMGGGCELALACDIRLASEKAKFGQPEIGLGITPGFGGTQRLPRNIGVGWAKYLVLSGRHIRADEALRIGLVQAVFPKDELMPQALKLADELAAKSPLAMRYCKAAVNAAADTDITTGQGIERDLFALAFASEDQCEGRAAFLEKRAAELNGR